MFSVGEVGLHGYILDSRYNVISENDNDGDWHNFSIDTHLEKGAYYLKVVGDEYYSYGRYFVYMGIPSELKVKANRPSGVYKWKFDLELSAEEGASIFYSTNRVDPLYESKKYIKPVEISKNTLVYVRAVKGNRVSSMFEFQYNVDYPMEQILMNKVTYLKKGWQQPMNYRIYPDKAEYNKLIWTSSDPEIVKVTQDGLIYGWKDGQATITVRNVDGSCSAQTLVTVYSEDKLLAYMEDRVGREGERVSIPILLSDVNEEKGISGYQFQINFDSERLKLEDVQVGELFQGQENDWEYALTTPGAIRFVYVNTDLEKGIKRSGQIATMNFVVKEGADSGEAGISFSESERIMFIDKNLNKIDAFYGSAGVKVRELLYGDLNNDSFVDVRDLYMIKRHILKIENSIPGDMLKYADLNGDGYVDVIDAMYVQRYILGQVTKFPVE